MTKASNALGARGEQAAAAYLASRGWSVLARNVRRREGEIDIVARRDSTLSFVEVKTRRSARYGSPAEAVTHRKMSRIRSLAAAMLADGFAHAPIIRFDVIEARAHADGTFSIRHIEGAF